MKEYYQVVQPFEHEIVIKKSRFITTLIPITDGGDAEARLQDICKKHSTATHNCYAYISNIIATEQRFSDNGEPQGTAGVPMLEVLKKRGIYMTLAVVTRYFGGIKLGASGLVRAYSDSVSEALDRADIKKFVLSNKSHFDISYTLFPVAVDNIAKYSGRVIDIEYGECVKITYAVPTDYAESLTAKLIDLCAGKINVQIDSVEYIPYDIPNSK